MYVDFHLRSVLLNTACSIVLLKNSKCSSFQLQIDAELCHITIHVAGTKSPVGNFAIEFYPSSRANHDNKGKTNCLQNCIFILTRPHPNPYYVNHCTDQSNLVTSPTDYAQFLDNDVKKKNSANKKTRELC